MMVVWLVLSARMRVRLVAERRECRRMFARRVHCGLMKSDWDDPVLPGRYVSVCRVLGRLERNG